MEESKGSNTRTTDGAGRDAGPPGTESFRSGVIEGFYGPPWGTAERAELFNWMAAWGLNTYLYAPKDDLKHRAIWREPYSEAEADMLLGMVNACRQRGLGFVYALAPGLDIRYGNTQELETVKRRFGQLLALNCHGFALLFDDIPDRLDTADLARYGSLASAQAFVANAIFQWLRDRNPQAALLFCPTPYCGRMAELGLGGNDYLPVIGRELLPEIEVLWTGPEIISTEIPVAHIQQLRSLLRRKPLIWDNLHANDYDGRRFYCGPYSGRPLELRQEVTGLLLNPNCEFHLNYVPLRTLAAFVRSEVSWNEREAYLSALREWLPFFATVKGPASLDDLVLFGDCFYLPHRLGPRGVDLYTALGALLGSPLAQWGARAQPLLQRARQLKDLCARLTELRHRPLFYALNRRAWELREELEILERYILFKSQQGNHNVPFRSDFHFPGVYRGGILAQLQQLLFQKADGTFAPFNERINLKNL